MPLDDEGVEKPLSTTQRKALLTKAEAFQSAIQSAKDWEATRGKGR